MTIVFETPDSFLAAKTALPGFIRKSRFLTIMTPHVFLKTRLERFLHTTRIGGWIVRFFFKALTESSFSAYSIPKDSPFRERSDLFWSIRTNDEGRVHAKSFYSLVNAGEIEVIAPARATGYLNDGKSVLLSNGRALQPSVVVLATGWKSSWTSIFDGKTVAEIGLGPHRPTINVKDVMKQWDYTSLSNPPPTHTANETDLITSIYRGIVPAKNIMKRDIAIVGAAFSSNITYSSEVTAHWIASYFRGDKLRLPNSTEEAIAEAEVRAAWMRRRYPNMISWANESYSGTLDFFTWVQAADELLEDMHLRSFRSRGNWFTWPFKVIDMKEIAHLTEERKKLRDFNRSMA